MNVLHNNRFARAGAYRCGHNVQIGLSKVAARAAAGVREDAVAETRAKIERLCKWLSADKQLPLGNVEIRKLGADFGQRTGFVASRELQPNQAVFEIPESLAVTSIDAEAHPTVGEAAKACGSQLVALTLWLLAERAKGADSAFAPMLQTLPASTLSPILWDDAERKELLAGSPVLEESRTRAAQLKAQWQALNDGWFSKQPDSFPAEVYNESSFAAAFCVVLAVSAYLPAADLFALLPLASLLPRTGGEAGCMLDFDLQKQAVVLTVQKPMRPGQELLVADGRPSGEMMLATGALHDDKNPADCLMFSASLIQADRYYMMKAQILESVGLGTKEEFPVYADRMPATLLAYLRLARIADPALFAKVSFDSDVVLSQMNEYEVLQLLMGDCRERIAAYPTSQEDDIKLLQSPALSPKQRLAARLRLSEKALLQRTVDGLRARLAPIRGIPTKAGGMQDPNADIVEIFDFIEGLPSAPKRLLDGLMGWARGDDDPEFKAKQAARKKAGGSDYDPKNFR